MLVTIDTSVVYQALRSSRGASFMILQSVRQGNIRIALSHAVLMEYEAVLTRPSSLHAFGLSRGEVLNILRFIAYVAEKTDPAFLFRPNLRDENDNMLIELAVASQSEYLITSNLRDFQSGELVFGSFRTVTPAEFIQIRRKCNE